MFTLSTARLTPKSAKRNSIVFTHPRVGAGLPRFTSGATFVNDATSSALSKSLRGTRFMGNLAEMHKFTSTTDGLDNILLVGLGKSTLENRDWFHLGLKLGKQIDTMGWAQTCLSMPEDATEADSLTHAQALIEGFAMALYRFDQYRTEQKPHQAARFENLTLLTTSRTARLLMEQWPAQQALIQGTVLTRNAANLPPNVANPQYMADQAKVLAKQGLKVTIIDEKEMAKLGLNLILAVGSSAAPADQPRLIIMEYLGTDKSEKPTAIVGKGVMFDTGGYNIKTGGSMGGMKFDMSGAAAILGTMHTLAHTRPAINVVGVMSCAMNMIGQTPFLPDSVYKSYKGLTVEIGNTDAEGRLVLADAIAYTIDKYQPTAVVDLATLTGACMVALGGAYAGLFSTSKPLANALHRAGEDTGERLWHMPIDDCYAAKTSVADVNNDGAPYGGASTGAVFIKRFADKTPWAHLDIAGVANAEKGSPGTPKEFDGGATGFGVRLLTRWLTADLYAAGATKLRSTPAKAGAQKSKSPRDPNTPARPRGRPRKTKE